MTEPPLNRELEDLEIDLLLEGIRRHYGFDLGDYDREYIRERVHTRLREEGIGTPSQLLDRVLRQPASLSALVEPRDPAAPFRPVRVWRAIRERAVPSLRTYPSVRAWVDGSSTDGDLLSILVILEEELTRPFTIYSTDLEDGALREARFGTLRSGTLRSLSQRYRRSGGKGEISRYLAATDGEEGLLPELKNRVCFGTHNPATDASFNSFHLILTRGSLSRFGPGLQDRSFQLIHESLIPLGFLLLGADESPDQGSHGRSYHPVVRRAGLYQKMSD